jgi:hypothetical protein
MATDNFAQQLGGSGGPYTDFAAATKSDTADLPFRCRALYIGVTGDVAVLAADNVTSVVFKAVPVGVLQVRTNRLMSTGTTATNVVALQ